MSVEHRGPQAITRQLGAKDHAQQRADRGGAAQRHVQPEPRRRKLLQVQRCVKLSGLFNVIPSNVCSSHRAQQQVQPDPHHSNSHALQWFVGTMFTSHVTYTVLG